VNALFTDLATLVDQQGVMIDNIESNIEDTRVHTSEAVKEVTKASNYQKSARSKMCWLALIIVIVMAVIAVIIVLKVTL